MSATILLALLLATAAAPCSGVDRSLPASLTAAVTPAIIAELHDPGASVMQSFRYGGWAILYVNTAKSDPPFLFYQRDPRLGASVAQWGGAAMASEQAEVERWTLAHASGIPPRLASCFAYHVTQDRDR